MDRREALTGLTSLIGGSLLAANISSFTPAHGTSPARKTKRKKVLLSDNWRFQMDVRNIGEEERWYEAGFARSRNEWGTVVVPQAWDCYEAALWQYEGVGWYELRIDPKDFISSNRTELYFSRVLYHSKVWINGTYLGENINGYLPFHFDITSHLRSGQENTVVMRVDNKPKLEWFPAAVNIEWIQYGGILDKVFLSGTAHTYIEDLIIRTTPANGGADIVCIANIVNETGSSDEMELTISIERNGILANKTLKFPTKTNQNETITIGLTLEKASLWSPETPVLYHAYASLKKGGLPVDDHSERFGIRKVHTEGKTILLNDKPFKIKGVNRYDDYALLGPTVPEKILREELTMMKKAGINMIRVHYPQSPDLISLYDEFGFVMMEEVPICWWGRNMEQNTDILNYARPALRNMIKRDKNHPCLIIWSMSNESITDNEAGTKVMTELLQLGKSLDPTRLVTYVLDGKDDPTTHKALEYADLIVVNKYYGILHEKICKHIADIEALGYNRFVEKMTEHRNAFATKPMFLGEFGAQGIKGIHGDLYYSEEFQAAFIERIWQGIESVPGLSGGILWCWADYYHRKYLIGYAAFGPYGVVTTDRKPKKSLAALTRMYGGRL